MGSIEAWRSAIERVLSEYAAIPLQVRGCHERLGFREPELRKYMGFAAA
jgi:hypothetical protein